MLEMLVGFVLTIVFFGLPLGIIALFVASILDQRFHEAQDISQDAAAPTTQSGDRGQRGYRREIVGMSGPPPTSWR
jgi:hypothetical protein